MRFKFLCIRWSQQEYARVSDVSIDSLECHPEDSTGTWLCTWYSRYFDLQGCKAYHQWYAAGAQLELQMSINMSIVIAGLEINAPQFLYYATQPYTHERGMRCCVIRLCCVYNAWQRAVSHQ